MPCATRLHRLFFFRVSRSCFLLLALLCFAVHPAKGAPPPHEVADLVWMPPESVSLLKLTESGAVPKTTKTPNPDEPTRLETDQLLVTFVRPGDRVLVQGNAGCFGLGFGAHAPDAIVWQTCFRQREVFRIPSLSRARFAVVRTIGQPANVQFRIAQPPEDPMAWYRADEAVWKWLHGPAQAEPPTAPMPRADAEETLRLLGALRRAWLAPDSATSQSLSVLSTWLQTVWLRQEAAYRPLHRPFYFHRRITIGNKPLPEEGIIVERGETVELQARHAEIFTIVAEGDAARQNVLSVFDAERLIHGRRVRLGRSSRRGRDWSIPAILRLSPGARSKVRVAVSQGRFRIGAHAYSARDALLGPRIHQRAPLRRRIMRQLGTKMFPEPGDETATPSNVWRDALIAMTRAQAKPVAGHLDELRSSARRLPGGAGAVPLLQVVLLESTLSEKLAALHALVELVETELDPSDGAALALAGIDAILAAGLEREQLEDEAKSLFPPELTNASHDLWLRSQQLAPPRTDVRPLLLARAEHEARPLSYQHRRVERLRDAWQEGAPWHTIEPEEPAEQRTKLALPTDGRPNGRCDVMTESGYVRWTLLQSEPLEVEVVGPSNGYERIWVRSTEQPAGQESLLAIDGQHVPIHSGAQLSSLIAVSPGKRRFHKLLGTPLLAKIPWEGRVPCQRLRIVQNWSVVRQPTRFVMPEGEGFTVARIRVDPQSLEDRESTLRVRVGGRAQRVNVTPPASGQAEIIVPNKARFVELSADRPTWLRVQARQFRGPAPPPSPPWIPRAALDEDLLIEQLRLTTRSLRRATTDEKRAKLRLRRARLLERLGYDRFGIRDVEFAEATSLKEAKKNASQEAAIGPPVLPLGTPPKIDILPMPEDTTPIYQAFTLRERGAFMKSAILPLINAFAPQRASSQPLLSTAGTLMLADWAEEAHLPLIAARAYESIARDHDQAEAFDAAADLFVEAARAEHETSQGTEHARRALRLACHAHLIDRRTPGVLGKLRRVLDWHRAPMNRAAGKVWLSTRTFDSSESKAVRVRRALVDAPPPARLFTHDRLRLNLRRAKSERLSLVAGCHALEGPREPCSLIVRIDGRRAECRPQKRAVFGSAAEPSRAAAANSSSAPSDAAGDKGELVPPDPNVAMPVSCSLPLPEEAGRLTVALPQEKAIGWAEVRGGASASPDPQRRDVLDRRWSWVLVTPEHPYRELVRSPSAVRIRFRGTRPGQQVRVSTQDGKSTRTFEVDAPLQEHARILGHEQLEVTTQQTHYIPIESPQSDEVRIEVDEPLLLRFYAASVDGAPEPSKTKHRPTPPPLSPRSTEYPSILTPPPTEPRHPMGPLTFGGTLSYEWPVLSESDTSARDQYLEVRPHAARELVPGLLWAEVAALLRLRNGGPISQGGELIMSMASGDWEPGGFLRARLVTQSFEDWAWGGRATLGVTYGMPLASNWKLLPMLSYTQRRAAPRPALSGTDLDVYSLYAQTRPRSLDGTVHLDHRPFVDTLLRTSSSVRWGPELRGMDRFELEVRVRTLPGAGWSPFLDTQLTFSHRPESPQRRLPFSRIRLSTEAIMWRWVTRNARVLLGAYGAYMIDFPGSAGAGSQLSAGLSLSADYTLGRGLADIRLFQRPFRDRLEEGAWPTPRAESRSGSIEEGKKDRAAAE